MARAGKAIINKLNTLMVKARGTLGRNDMKTMLDFYLNCVECYGDEFIYMNFSNPELVVVEEAIRLRKRGLL